MPSTSVSLFRRCASLGALLVLSSLRSLAADGDLDPSFDPSNSPRPFMDLIQAHRDFVYFAHWTGSASEVRRLRADGSVDPTWTLPVSNLFIEGFTLLPTGGIAVATGAGLYVDPGEGNLSRVESLNRRNGPVRLFARSDGSVIQAANYLSETFSDAVQDNQERMIFVGRFQQAPARRGWGWRG